MGDEPLRRRRRVRGQAGANAPTGTPDWAPGATGSVGTSGWVADPGAIDPGAETSSDLEPATDSDAATGAVERGLRGLVGAGSSQVSPAAAMRARDAARPRPDDLDRAEAELVIIRRHWTARD